MVFVWLVGILGVVFNFLIYQQKERKKILLQKLLADCSWTAHYLMLSALSGAAVCAVGILREVVFINQDKKWARGKGWLLAFFCIGACSAVLTWSGWYSALPALASAISVYSFWKGIPKLTKKLALPISLMFLTYNIYCHSHVGIINEALVLTSLGIDLIKNRRGFLSVDK